MKEYIKLARIKHYIKNTLIFLPLLFGRKLFNKDLLLLAIIGFICFSLISSVVYIINDIKDIESDKKHPIKKFRPLAAGKVSVFNAYVMAVILFMTICIIYIFTPIQKESFIFIVVYLALNIMYSFGLKNVPIIDILILVSGFMLRVLYGSYITSITSSDWLYLTVISISFYLGLGKRRNELQKNNKTILNLYTKEFLDKNMCVFLGLLISFYSLWAINISIPYVIYTIILVITIILKYSLEIEKDIYADPVDVLTNDKILMFLVIVYIVVILILLYFLK